MVELKSEKYLRKVASKLASLIDEGDPEEIFEELKAYVEEGNFTAQGAIAAWKSDHKFEIGLGMSRDFLGRVIGIEAPRLVEWRGGESQVQGVHFLVLEGGLLSYRSSTFWGERIEVASQFELDKVYKFRAFEKTDLELNRIRDIEEVEDSEVPTVWEIEQYGGRYDSLAELEDKVGQMVLVRAWVGKLIQDQETGEIYGIEISDEDSPPVSAWSGGKFSEPPEAINDMMLRIDRGDEVIVYGYVSEKEGLPRISMKGIFLHEEKTEAPAEWEEEYEELETEVSA